MSHEIFQQLQEGSARIMRSASLAAEHDAEESRLAAVAHAEYASRRRRDALFHPGIFAEPAWDMLLDLYVQEHLKRPVSIHSLCIAAAVPPTTALRWIGRLVECGLMIREPSRRDNRVVHIALTATGRHEMEQYLRSKLVANANGQTRGA